MIFTDNGAQLYHLFLFGGFGFLLGAYYDLFRVWRVIAHSSKVAVFFQDVLFCLSSALAFFVIALAVTKGILRWYLLTGTALGFGAYRATVGRVIVRWVCRLLRRLRRIAHAAGAPVRWVCRVLRVPLWNVARFFGNMEEKVKIFLKKVLKLQGLVLYTKFRLLDVFASHQFCRKEMPPSDEQRISQKEKRHLPTHRSGDFRDLRGRDDGAVAATNQHETSGN